MLVWGLTGNIACGKSAVEGMLSELGVPVIDSDQVAREIVAPGEPALQDIESAFGSGVLDAAGALDRPKLGAIVFSDPEKRRILEGITHPRIAERTLGRLASLAQEGHPVAVVSAALMVETGSHSNYAGMVVVTCPDDLQLQRLMDRDKMTAPEALKRIGSQWPQGRKTALAQAVIDNGGHLDDTRSQVQALVQTWNADPAAG